MNRLIIFMLLIGLTFSCSDEQQKLNQQIASLEKTFESDNAPENANQLVTLYSTYLEKFPNDQTTNPRYLYRIAGIHYRMNKLQESEKYLKRALRDYPQNDNAFNCGMLLGNIYEENYGNQFVAHTVYQNLAEVFPQESQNVLQSKLPSNLAAADQRLQTLQLQIFNDSTGVINYQKANDFINASELFALINPQNAGIPETLFKAAETARTIRANEKALDFYTWIHNQYPQHPKASQALFLQAFTLDNEMGKTEEARSLYEKFIAEYPKDEFVDDAQFLLKNLGKTNEEIIKSFEEQQNTAN